MHYETIKNIPLTCCLTLCSFGHAETVDVTKEYVSPEETKQQVLADDIERIGVTSKVPLLYFKRQAMLAELDFYMRHLTPSLTMNNLRCVAARGTRWQSN